MEEYRKRFHQECFDDLCEFVRYHSFDKDRYFEYALYATDEMPNDVKVKIKQIVGSSKAKRDKFVSEKETFFGHKISIADDKLIFLRGAVDYFYIHFEELEEIRKLNDVFFSDDFRLDSFTSRLIETERVLDEIFDLFGIKYRKNSTSTYAPKVQKLKQDNNSMYPSWLLIWMWRNIVGHRGQFDNWEINEQKGVVKQILFTYILTIYTLWEATGFSKPKIDLPGLTLNIESKVKDDVEIKISKSVKDDVAKQFPMPNESKDIESIGQDGNLEIGRKYKLKGKGKCKVDITEYCSYKITINGCEMPLEINVSPDEEIVMTFTSLDGKFKVRYSTKSIEEKLPDAEKAQIEKPDEEIEKEKSTDVIMQDKVVSQEEQMEKKTEDGGNDGNGGTPPTPPTPKPKPTPIWLYVLIGLLALVSIICIGLVFTNKDSAVSTPENTVIPINISVSPDNVSFSADSGTSSHIFSVYGSTTEGILVYEDLEWISISLNGNQLMLVVDKNMSESFRSGVVTAKYGTASCSISVSQKGREKTVKNVSKEPELDINYKKGMEAFNNNNGVEALRYFEQSKSREAYDMITLIYQNGCGNVAPNKARAEMRKKNRK